MVPSGRGAVRIQLIYLWGFHTANRFLVAPPFSKKNPGSCDGRGPGWPEEASKWWATSVVDCKAPNFRPSTPGPGGKAFEGNQ